MLDPALAGKGQKGPLAPALLAPTWPGTLCPVWGPCAQFGDGMPILETPFPIWGLHSQFGDRISTLLPAPHCRSADGSNFWQEFRPNSNTTTPPPRAGGMGVAETPVGQQLPGGVGFLEGGGGEIYCLQAHGTPPSHPPPGITQGAAATPSAWCWGAGAAPQEPERGAAACPNMASDFRG